MLFYQKSVRMQYCKHLVHLLHEPTEHSKNAKDLTARAVLKCDFELKGQLQPKLCPCQLSPALRPWNVEVIPAKQRNQNLHCSKPSKHSLKEPVHDTGWRRVVISLSLLLFSLLILGCWTRAEVDGAVNNTTKLQFRDYDLECFVATSDTLHQCHRFSRKK